jgi:hypothetical protein
MACEELMAVLAGVVDAATSRLDRDDVERRAVMGATGLRIYFHSSDFWSWQLHMLIRTQYAKGHSWRSRLPYPDQPPAQRFPKRPRMFIFLLEGHALVVL